MSESDAGKLGNRLEEAAKEVKKATRTQEIIGKAAQHATVAFTQVDSYGLNNAQAVATGQKQFLLEQVDESGISHMSAENAAGILSPDMLNGGTAHEDAIVGLGTLLNSETTAVEALVKPLSEKATSILDSITELRSQIGELILDAEEIRGLTDENLKIGNLLQNTITAFRNTLGT